MITYKNFLLRRYRTRRRGAAVVELAITLPVFLVFLFNIIQWGWCMNALVTQANVARDTARYGAVRALDATGYTEMQNYAINLARAERLVDPTTGTVTFKAEYSSNAGSTTTPTWTTANASTVFVARNAVKITITADLSNRNFHLPMVFIPSNLVGPTHSAYAVMFIEPQS